MTMQTVPTTQAETPPTPKSTALQVRDWMSAPTMQRALSAALTGYMDETTFAAQCYLAAQDPKLSQCDPRSLMRAFLECAQMGFLPGSHHKHVALVPRAGVITVVPQWQGFKFLMERQPGIKRVRPVLVHRRDQFDLIDGIPRHKYDPFDDERVFEHPDVAREAKRECSLRGGYLVIEREGIEPEYHFVSAGKIHRNRACAETQKLWRQWFEEMCLKTVLRDAWSKRIVSIDPQLEERIGRADDADNRALGNDPARAIQVVQSSRTEALADRVSGALGPGTITDDLLPDMAGAPQATEEAKAIPADPPADPPPPAVAKAEPTAKTSRGKAQPAKSEPAAKSPSQPPSATTQAPAGDDGAEDAEAFERYRQQQAGGAGE